MSDIELVVKIPRKVYKAICDKNALGCDISDIKNIIRNGTPLPKRMLSVDLIIETLCPKDEDYDYPCIAPSYLEQELERLLLDDSPTADKE